MQVMQKEILMAGVLIAFYPIQLLIVLLMKSVKIEYLYVYIFAFVVQLLLAFIKRGINKRIEIFVEILININIAFVVALVLEVALTVVLLLDIINGFAVFFFNGVIASVFVSTTLFRFLEKLNSE